MNTLKKNFSRKVLAIGSGVLAVLVVLMGISFSPQKAQAAELTGDLHGYAWSDTIGWISLNCAEGSATGTSVCSTNPYKVTVSSDNFSGYAWSENVGWISFNTADGAALCSSGTTGFLDPATGNVTGWARVVSGTAASGADGCINLGGATYGLHYDSSTTSATLPGHRLAGYAWGDTNLGWVDFEYATLDAGATTSCLVVTKNTFYPNSTTIPNAHHFKIGSYSVRNNCSTEAIGLTTMTVGITPTTLPITNLTNLKATIHGASAGSTYPTPTVSNPINIAPNVVPPNTTYVFNIFSDLGTSTSGSLTTTLLAVGNGLSTGAAYSSTPAVLGQTITLVPTLPPGTIQLLANGVPTYAFTDSTGGPADISWEASPDVTSCVAAPDTIDPTEAYWKSTNPAPITLATGYVSVTIPANVGSATAAHVYGIHCSSSIGAIATTAEIDVPPPGAPTLNFTVNYMSAYAFPTYAGGFASLAWTTTGMTSCATDTTAGKATSAGYWTATTPITVNSGGPFAISIPANASTTTATTYTYGIRCLAGATAYPATVTITVPPNAPPGTPGAPGTGGPVTAPWKEI